ncbi:protein HOTHEAD-like [Chenopodium quinoa]|uniref:Glucose-methanol-choline oxidoreductase N-terminal domain-containing protein n=1 Tax=Chenopodium quinoa TaxID=63459 RepID=A0A803M0K4_CHEQI|nr:protein HOTHEAD-like [Chenopodium quinoa]
MDSECRKLAFIFIFGVSFFYASFAEKAPHFSFVKPATLAPAVSYFDYIVVGGGTAGCSLAATLSDGATVLLLERGGVPYGNKNVEDIGSFGANLANVSPSSPSQGFVSEDGVLNARARVLGGGSAINAGFYTRAPPEFVAKVGWDYGLVNQSYAWVERKVAFEPPMLQFQTAVKDGLLQAGVQPYNGFTYDHIHGTKFGGTIFDNNGHRHTAADLLEYADPRRATVYLYAVAQKILFSRRELGKPRAYGVIFKDSVGIVHKAFLRPGAANEVILSAGALGSPQLLMLSGVGPATELMLHGIEVVLDQPQVGQGMADNPMNLLFIPSPISVETSLIQAVGITEFGSFIEAASGSSNVRAFMQNLPSAAQMLTSQASQSSDGPNVITTQGDLDTAIEYMHSLLNGTINSGCILEKIAGPRSSGYLHLATVDPNDNPAVRFNYFQDPDDLQRCVMGMETIIKVIESEPFSKFRVPGMTTQALINIVVNFPLNLRPRHFSTALSLEQFCIDTVLSIWHYHGGCQVNKVVDKDYKVLGTVGLRVIDGSTFYDSPGTNPQATVMMLGRYMGQRILAQRR